MHVFILWSYHPVYILVYKSKDLFVETNCFQSSREDPRAKQLSTGKKKFNMDPDKVRTTGPYSQWLIFFSINALCYYYYILIDRLIDFF